MSTLSEVPLRRRLLVEPARPAAVREHPKAPWLVVGTVCVGAFMGQLDASIVTLALPGLARVFHAPVSDVEWVALAYLLVLVGLVTAVGRLADMVGRKLLYTYGFGVFVLGSALCGVAPNLGFLVGARVLQALGAAMLQANSVALIAGAMPPEKLGRGIGIQGAAQAVGLAVGPAVGGALLAIGGWRLLFLVNVPAGLVGIVLGWFLLPRSRGLAARTRFDLPGALLLAGAAAGLLAALSYGRSLGWGSPAIVALLVVTAVTGASFITRLRRAPSPLIDPGLFRRVSFSAGTAAGLLSYLVMFGVLFLVPFHLSALDLPPATIGLVLTALPVALALAAPVAGRAADRLGARPVTVAGLALAAVALIGITVAPGTATLTVALAVAGLGLGAFTPANNAAIMASAPRHSSGVAAGVLNMTRGMGTALGVAVTALIYQSGADGHAFVRAGLTLAAVAALGALVASARSSRRPPVSSAVELTRNPRAEECAHD